MAEKKLVVKVAGKEISLPSKKTEASKGRPQVVVFEKNPFISAKKVPRRVKALFYGPTGSRKTRTALQFPRPAVADLEDGTKWYADQFEFAVLPDIHNFATYVGAIDYLARGGHPYLTFVTDPSTITWELLQKQWSDTFLIRNIGGKGFKFDFYNMQPGDWKHVKAEWKDTMKRLMDLDMHVIFTARTADLLSSDGGDMMRKIGERPDGEKNVKYYFDIVLKLENNPEGKTIAVVEKDRTGKLPNVPFHLTYKTLEEAFGKEYLYREIDQTLMPAPSTDEPETVTIELPPGDVISHDTNGIDVEPPEPPAEPPKTKVTLPKEEAKEEPKKPDKPAGSTGNPIQIVVKKKGKKKEEKKEVAPGPEMCTDQQEKDIREFCETLEISEKRMFKSLTAYDAVDFATLTKEKADKIIKNLEKKLKEKR